MIKIQHLRLSFGDKQVLDIPELDIPPGKMIGLIGPNGAGKTSLLRILAQVEEHYTGDITYQDKPLEGYSLKTLAKEFGYLAQDATAHWPLKVERLIALGRLPYQGVRSKLTKEDKQAIEDAANKTEVTHLVNRIATTLSGGERARVFLARLFAANPKVIFADEPVAALDPYHQLHIMEILKEHATQGGTVIVVLHDLNLAARFCDELILLDQGKIVDQGNIHQLIEKGLLESTYDIGLKMFCEEDGWAIIPWERKSKETSK